MPRSPIVLACPATEGVARRGRVRFSFLVPLLAAFAAASGGDGATLSMRRMRGARAFGASGDAGDQCGPWCFLHAYPRHYVANRLGPGQRIVVDGDLSDEAWQQVAFSADAWQDIAQPLFPDFVLPTKYATSFKVRWDDDFLYIGAKLGEPFVSGIVTGHNPTLKSPNPLPGGFVPYYDNDFEVFIDVSGTNYYYKEFEMNFLNATYDVLWRVPDGSVPCGGNRPEDWCVNTSAKVYPGTWSMYPRLSAATAAAEGGWTAEVAFPLRGAGPAGGLLDGGRGWDRFDPNGGARYWMLDFARAEHPFFNYENSLFAPLCGDVRRQRPTLLGLDQWSCYFEYVWQPLGGTKYMHNPDLFGILEFAPSQPLAQQECLMAEWPARYVLSQVWRVQTAYLAQWGHYATQLQPLVQQYCTTANSCNAADLSAALTDHATVFNLEMQADNAATSCVNYKPKSPSGGPCFVARINMTVGGRRVIGSIRENRYLDVRLFSDVAGIPCLAA